MQTYLSVYLFIYLFLCAEDPRSGPHQSFYHYSVHGKEDFLVYVSRSFFLSLSIILRHLFPLTTPRSLPIIFHTAHTYLSILFRLSFSLLSRSYYIICSLSHHFSLWLYTHSLSLSHMSDLSVLTPSSHTSPVFFLHIWHFLSFALHNGFLLFYERWFCCFTSTRMLSYLLT